MWACGKSHYSFPPYSLMKICLPVESLLDEKEIRSFMAFFFLCWSKDVPVKQDIASLQGCRKDMQKKICMVRFSAASIHIAPLKSVNLWQFKAYQLTAWTHLSFSAQNTPALSFLRFPEAYLCAFCGLLQNLQLTVRFSNHLFAFLLRKNVGKGSISKLLKINFSQI